MLLQNLLTATPHGAPQISRIPAMRLDLLLEVLLHSGGMLNRAAALERGTHLRGDCGWAVLVFWHEIVTYVTFTPAVRTNLSYTQSAAAVASPTPVTQNQIIVGRCSTSPK